MKDADWKAWVKEHSALLGMSGPVAADLFGAWKKLLANATLEELQDASEFIAGSVELVEKPWATHLALIRRRLSERRQAKKRSTAEKAVSSIKAPLGFSSFEEAAKDAERKRKEAAKRAGELNPAVLEALSGIGKPDETKTG